jgi:hypothetical protein
MPRHRAGCPPYPEGVSLNLEEPMKIILVALLLTATLSTAFAEDVLTPQAMQQELTMALEQMSATQIGTLTVGDLLKAAERVSLASQKIHYVQRARMASMMLPGTGQFMTGDALGGSLYLTADLAVMAGTMIGAYYLLPANVQFMSFDYMNRPMADIHTTWLSNNISSYLPSLGVMAGGMVLKGVLGHFAAQGAAARARKNIADGTVTFTPRLGFFDSGFGMGMMMRY